MPAESGSRRRHKSHASHVVSTRTPTVSRRRPGLWSWFGGPSERAKTPLKTKTRKKDRAPKAKASRKVERAARQERGQQRDPAPHIDLSTEQPSKAAKSSLVGAYFKAIIVGFATSIAFVGLLSGVGGGLGDLKVIQYVTGAMASLTMAPVLAIPAFVLSRIAAQMNIPRGFSDVLIGGILGSIMFAGDGALVQQFAFVLGGMVGGFTFWQARGCPEASDATSKTLEAALRGAR